MGILAEPNEVELVVTWVCNWHCPYCAVDTHNRHQITIDDVMAKISNLPLESIVTISGGEVGSMKREHVVLIINTLIDKQCKLRINTNGLFIKRFADLIHHFDLVLYHCSEDLHPCPIDQYDYPQVEYMIIVTDQNMHRLDDFLKVNPNIDFHIVASTLPVGVEGDILSPRHRNRVIIQYHNRMTQVSKLRFFKEKDFDAITYL